MQTNFAYHYIRHDTQYINKRHEKLTNIQSFFNKNWYCSGKCLELLSDFIM